MTNFLYTRFVLTIFLTILFLTTTSNVSQANSKQERYTKFLSTSSSYMNYNFDKKCLAEKYFGKDSNYSEEEISEFENGGVIHGANKCVNIGAISDAWKQEGRGCIYRLRFLNLKYKRKYKRGYKIDESYCNCVSSSRISLLQKYGKRKVSLIENVIVESLLACKKKEVIK